MIDKLSEYWQIFLYAVAAISGGLGGCGAASYAVLNADQKVLRISIVLAYMFVGSMLGVMIGAFGYMIGIDNTRIISIVPFSLLAGFFGSILMAGGHFTIRWVLSRFFNIEVTVTARRKDQNRRKS